MAKPETVFDRHYQMLHGKRLLSLLPENKKAAEVERAMLLGAMRQARRVVVDEAARQVVVDAMRDRFAELTASLQFVRLPFDPLWIEWPLVGGSFRGVLIEAWRNEPGLYEAVCPVCVFKPTSKETEKMGVLESVGLTSMRWDFRDEVPKPPPETAVRESGGDDNNEVLSLLPEWVTDRASRDVFERRCWPVVRPYFELTKAALVEKLGQERVGDLLWAAIKAEVEEAWFPVIVLALMQQRVLVVPDRQFRPKGAMILKGRRVPFLGRSVIEIALPRVVHATDGESAGHGAPKRRHEVAGHWCFNRRVDPGCAHDWQALVSGQRYQCAKCGGKRWRRRAHERGNATLGWVQQERHVVRGELRV